MLVSKITRRHLEVFLARHATKKRTLDIGSGGSIYGKFFPNRVTMDIDPKRKPDVIGDAHDVPFKDNEFEVVLCTEALAYMRDPRRAINEMSRVLAPDGVLILSTRFMFPFCDSRHDYWRFTQYGLRELLSQWEIVELTPETTNFETIAVILQRLVYQGSFYLDKLIKLILLVSARIVPLADKLIRKQYGDITKSFNEEHIMASGYFLVALNKK